MAISLKEDEHWPEATLKQALKQYQTGLGVQHPEMQITLGDFAARLATFELEVHRWIDNDRKASVTTVARRWAKANGLKSWDAVPLFNKLFVIVDARFPIS